MKDKTQKSFRGIVRILLLVFCYTFGSHAFALALEHEQTVDIYKVTDVPNPRNESSSNWVSNPNQILDESYVWEINNMLSQLEDSLSIEAVSYTHLDVYKRQAKSILAEIVSSMFLNSGPHLSLLAEMKAHAMDMSCLLYTSYRSSRIRY